MKAIRLHGRGGPERLVYEDGVCPWLEQRDPFTRNHDEWGMRDKAI